MRQVRLTTKRAFTLVETMICMIILLIAGLSTVGSILYTRMSMELDKQRIAALSYCRQTIEAANSLDTVFPGSRTLVPFNSPGTEDLNAEVTIEYFPFDANGAVIWHPNPKLTAPSMDQPTLVRVSVTWRSYGRAANDMRVSMQTIVTKGIV